MDKYTESMRASFKEEANELLTELESSLLELEDTPEDSELIGRVFRAMHTIKGSGAMFGFEEISNFTHEVETVFDLVRNGKLSVTKELIDLTLLARDQILAMMEAAEGEEAKEAVRSAEIITLLRKLSQDIGPQQKAAVQAPAAPSPAEEAKKESKQITYQVHFRPPENIFLTGTNPVLLLNELRELGDCQIAAHRDRIPPLDALNPEYCYTNWEIILTTSHGENAIKDVFIFVEYESDLKIKTIAEKSPAETEAQDKKIGEILVEQGKIDQKNLEEVLSTKKPIGKMLVDAGLVSSEEVESALLEQQHLRETQEKQRKEESITSIRVHSSKLDTLVDLVGELVTVQARLSQTSSTVGSTDLTAIAEEVERLISELRDNAMNLRMVPIGTTFNRFKRLVRDLSKQMGKDIQLTTEGAETELDKTVIERLNDPLIHLIRNCIDHGIEPPEEREGLGKPRTGNIHLSSSHSGAYVLIQIRDDGTGLNMDKILAKASEKGLINPETEVSEKEILQLIFTPGFSTAEKVTGVSGRGVGMDVAKRTIDSLGGSIEIDSAKGKGTTITLKIPLTLAIIEGLLVKIEDEFFIFPMGAVEECVELSRSDIKQTHGRNIINIRGNILPYINLRQMFAIGGDPPAIEQIVIAGSSGHRLGFVVDEVIGELQTVIKSLGRAYRDVDGVSGATILGDGTVALILDILRLTQSAESEENMEARKLSV